MEIILIGKRIKALAREKKISLKSIIEKIGISPRGYSQGFKNGTFRVTWLLIVAEELGVSVGELVSEKTPEELRKIKRLKLETDMLEKGIKKLDDLREKLVKDISKLERTIKTYENDPENLSERVETIQECIEQAQRAIKSKYFNSYATSEKKTLLAKIREKPEFYSQAWYPLFDEENEDYVILFGIKPGTLESTQKAYNSEETTQLFGKYLNDFLTKKRLK